MTVESVLVRHHGLRSGARAPTCYATEFERAITDELLITLL